MKKIIAIIASLVLAISLFSCAGPTQQGRGAKTGVLIGAAGGAILGQVIGGHTESTLLGAAIGAAFGGIAGHQIGAYMDRQEQELRSAMAASEAAIIQRTQNVLTATFRSEYLFDFGSSTLKPGAYAEIGRVANVLNRYPQTTIRVEGHTDSKGSEAYNQTLSEKRSVAVKSALTQRGVDPTRIQTVGFGESQPISSNDAMNRRVVIIITDLFDNSIGGKSVTSLKILPGKEKKKKAVLPPIKAHLKVTVWPKPRMGAIFDGSESKLPKPLTARYELDYDGDGSWDYTETYPPQVEFAFSNSGSFTAHLRISASNGQQVKISRDYTIEPKPGFTQSKNESKPETKVQTDPEEEKRQAKEDYDKAYRKMADLMAEGKGETPEAQQAYDAYKKAKERYEHSFQ